MGYIDKGALLGASDLREEDVELESIGAIVRVRGLPAAYSNEAQSEALEMVTDARGRQTARVNTKIMESLQVLHGLVDPKLSSIEEAHTFAQNCGPAFRKVVDAIDRLSGVDKEAVEKANATFPAGGSSPAGDGLGVAAGRNGSDFPVRVGVGAGDDGE